ncbi:MAG: hypothetical protein UU64_C0001G0062 [candidate division WWE3 bacterium GW2011_GWF2_41_45]|uniref:Uncharacterized protein n=3 Tax=Katanobacteria TaxID=422282 RepID=A0A1F4W3K2_UNCKA|nr:MAG: hypothetical protein UU55_C0002G0027 [candidate division WWE3 bacterium GW2011_GWC2_41_23]KKS10793.1 MAG: hypothetical protein UU64_C0001G0062 [candidate division WWE3 bacterium GW2011_GWF2_41_45]KKS12469.1 MAG: hypothetical protein UU68_C0001G0061 [candidate division WWE3 bacterium GW2011_GWF1_41_53]KKS20152.1 MAG: hypothetical protein UU79_C0003G0025 [candidate division WWE3 bacterium GW2011_GWE1_41_72]KKS28481.1 MAG: hypothetical protein UU86_C0001G0001 [candidate division WWE3 bacte
MIKLRELPVNARVFVSPGAFIKFEEKLYINLNSQINAVCDPSRYFTVEVTRQEQGVLVNMSTLPEPLLALEIVDKIFKRIIDDHFHPITLEGYRLFDTC